jgi:hypothetical protein
MSQAWRAGWPLSGARVTIIRRTFIRRLSSFTIRTMQITELLLTIIRRPRSTQRTACYGPYGGVGSAAWYNPSTGAYGRAYANQYPYGGRCAKDNL